jgi:hypothetical protein
MKKHRRIRKGNGVGWTRITTEAEWPYPDQGIPNFSHFCYDSGFPLDHRKIGREIASNSPTRP